MERTMIEVIDLQPVPAAEAKGIAPNQVMQPLPPGPLAENEVEGQAPYWQYYRCGCGTVFRVMLDTEQRKYFYCGCGRYMYRA